MAISEFQFNLLSCHDITPRVKHFIGQIQSDVVWHFIPGQFITIIFKHEQKILRRSYSIANSPNLNNSIEFAASYVEGGPGTQFLYNLKPGDSFKVTGPFGRLVLKETDAKRVFLIGTSTGITPYRAMLPSLANQSQIQFEIIQGASQVEDILFEEDFLNFCAKHSNAQFTAAISREISDKNHHHHGRIQSVLKEKNLNPTEDIVYLCGNPQMIDETTTLLQDLGFPIQSIIREKYISR